MKNAQKKVIRVYFDVAHNKQIVCANPARDHLQVTENDAHRHRASASDRALMITDNLSFVDVVPRRRRLFRDRRPLMLEAAPSPPLNQLALLPVNGLPDEQLPHRKREIARRKIYLCNICGKSFEKYQALGGHKAQHTKANKKMKLVAPLEGGSSSRPSRARNLAVVVRGQSHRCELCGREFAKAQALAVHKRHCKNRVLRIRS